RHDAAGHLVAVEHPLVGVVRLRRDADGRLVEIADGHAATRWEYRDGWVSAHTDRRPDGREQTSRVLRDAAGRITTITGRQPDTPPLWIGDTTYVTPHRTPWAVVSSGGPVHLSPDRVGTPAEVATGLDPWGAPLGPTDGAPHVGHRGRLTVNGLGRLGRRGYD